MLKIASRDGGFAAPALTVGPNGPDLAPGDFVAWQAAEFSSEVAVASSDSRFGWVGLILGRLKPEWTTKGWVVADRFG